MELCCRSWSNNFGSCLSYFMLIPKEKDGKGYVIEVNDNPNIDSGVEDKYLGDELYRLIMGELLRRMENRSKGILTL